MRFQKTKKSKNKKPNWQLLIKPNKLTSALVHKYPHLPKTHTLDK